MGGYREDWGWLALRNLIPELIGMTDEDKLKWLSWIREGAHCVQSTRSLTRKGYKNRSTQTHLVESEAFLDCAEMLRRQQFSEITVSLWQREMNSYLKTQQTFLVKAFLNAEAAPLIFQYSHLFTGCLLGGQLSNWMQSVSPGLCVSVLSVEARSFERRLCGPANWARSILRDSEQVGTVATSKRF